MGYNLCHNQSKYAKKIFDVRGIGGLSRTYDPEFSMMNRLIKEAHVRPKPKLVAAAATGGFKLKTKTQIRRQHETTQTSKTQTCLLGKDGESQL